MQSDVIRTGKPLLENDLGGRVAGDAGGTLYGAVRGGPRRRRRGHRNSLAQPDERSERIVD